MATKLKVVSEYSDKGLKRAKSDVGAFGRYTSGVFKQVGGVIAGVFAVRSIINFVKTSIGAYFRQEKAVESLRQALLSTAEAQSLMTADAGNMQRATEYANAYTSQLQKAASALQVLTRVGDEAIMEIMTIGTSMGIATSNLDEAAQAAVVFNKRFGIDTQTAMRGIALAMQGNTAQLSRYIPALRGVTDAGDAFNMITSMSNTLLKQQSELSLTNAERALAVKAAYGDLTEQIGAFFIESGLAQNIMDELLFAIEDIQAVGFGAWFEETFPALDAFIDRITEILDGLGLLRKAAQEPIKTKRDMEAYLTGTRMGTGLTEMDVARGVGRPAEQRTRAQIEAGQTEMQRRLASRETERQQRRAEREERKQRRLEESRALIEGLRSAFTPSTQQQAATTAAVQGGQALSAGDLFERAFGATMAAANGSRQNPYYVVLNNPEDINTGLAE